MWTWRTAIVPAAILAAAPPALPQAPVYDIRAELVSQGQGTLYAVQIRNVGPVIPGPVRAEFHLLLPAGLTVTSWTLNGMGCAPAPPPKSGPVDIVCSRVLNAAWAAGTILSNQIFIVSKLAGTKPGQVCLRALLQLPKPPAAGYFTVAETNATNNSICV